MKYFSCSLINRFHMNINGRIDNGSKTVALCCEPVSNVPAVALRDTGKETIKSFNQMRENLLSESMLAPSQRVFTKGCAECVNYKLAEWKKSKTIGYINFSMYPAPCQCRCIYCGVYDDNKNIGFNDPSVTEGYGKVFDALDYAKQNGLIDSNAFYQVSSGEISVHPYRDRIFEFVKQSPVCFYTNAFKYCDEIGEILSQNPVS